MVGFWRREEGRGGQAPWAKQPPQWTAETPKQSATLRWSRMQESGSRNKVIIPIRHENSASLQPLGLPNPDRMAVPCMRKRSRSPARPFRPRQGAGQSSSPESLSLQPCVYASPSSLRSERRSSRSSGFNDLAINCRIVFSLLFVFDVVVSAPWMSNPWLGGATCVKSVRGNVSSSGNFRLVEKLWS